MRDRFELPLAPVLGAKHDHAFTNADHHHLQQKLNLIAQRNAGQRVLRVRANHEVIGQVDRIGEQVLQGERQYKAREYFVKVPVMHQLLLCHREILRFIAFGVWLHLTAEKRYFQVAK